MDAVRDAAPNRTLRRWYYADDVVPFLLRTDDDVLGALARTPQAPQAERLKRYIHSSSQRPCRA